MLSDDVGLHCVQRQPTSKYPVACHGVLYSLKNAVEEKREDQSFCGFLWKCKPSTAVSRIIQTVQLHSHRGMTDERHPLIFQENP